MVATIASLFAPGPAPPSGGSASYPVPAPASGQGQIIINPTAPVDVTVDTRLRQFYQAYTDASSNKAQVGAFCEQIVVAVTKLQPEDEASAAGAQRDAIQEAQRCLPLVAESDQRVTAIDAAYKRYDSVRTLGAAEATLMAANAMTDFDRARDLAGTGAAAEKLGGLQAAVDAYRKLLARIASVAPLYRPGDPATLATAIELAALGREAVASGFARSDPTLLAAEAQGLASATTAADAIADSDRKIAILAQAFARRTEDPVGLAIALGSLSPFDRARAVDPTASPVDLAAVEAGASGSLGPALDRSAESYQQAATFDGARTLSQIEALAKSLGAGVSASSARVVEQARRDLAGSELRLRALAESAARWLQQRARRQRDAALESRIGEVLTAIVPAGMAEPNSFDAAAMNAQDRAALATLISAWVEVQGRAAPSQRGLLKVALEQPANADGATGVFLSNVAGHLAQLGFTVTSTPEGAGLVLKLSAPGLQEGGMNADGMPQRKAVVRGSMVWTYNGRSDDLGTVTGIGADRDKRVITEAALRSAAQQVANTVASKAEGV